MTVEQVDTTAVAAQLVKDLRRQVTILEEDLRAQSDELSESREALQAEYAEAKKAQRTAAPYESWRDERVTQVAAAWVLGTVFVRYCEDNGLIARPFIAGPGERLADAEELHEAYFREYPNHNDRDWIVTAFDHLAAAHPTAAGLFDRKHNPLWEISPSFEASSALLQFWRRRGDDGEIRYNFTDWDTRFLGDLYQDLSEHARKTYALLQTPEFVEEFILDLTLEPAVKEFGLNGLRTIDPACGSGHFLLGIFRRLLAKWRAAEPGAESWDLIRHSLGSIHGCDKNPFAVSIARFRLLVAVLQSAEIEQLSQAPAFPINIAVGDSLMHGRGINWEQIELNLFEGRSQHTYRTEDVTEYVESCDLLGLYSYHVVVGNPPYITAKDKRENDNYRKVYAKVCSGKYALSVPFVQRLFELAVRVHGSSGEAGFVGQITANSFMKREFGKKLIEEFFPTVSLSYVIDTSGVYIPGHGTPTVILVGRNRIGREGDPIRAALGVRGEPRQPERAADGVVWRAIGSQIGRPGSESEWITVEDVSREQFANHPWSVSGGGAGNVFAAVARGTSSLGGQVRRLGVFGMTNADDVMLAPSRAWLRKCPDVGLVKKLLLGDEIRDWGAVGDTGSFFPYDSDMKLLALSQLAGLERWMWPTRTVLGNRATFSKGTYFTDDRPWYGWHQLTSDPGGHPWVIVFAEVATHNHFYLDRGSSIFKQTAPVVKLLEGASEDDHLALLGILNSSTACFWLKQVSHNKGNTVDSKGARTTAVPWEDFYQFTSSKLQEFPIPPVLPLGFGRDLDMLAQQLAGSEPSSVCALAVPSSERLKAARMDYERIRRRMIALQEELDWASYHSYGLLIDAERAQLIASDLENVPEIGLGERAFEIALARKVAAGESDTAWFARHRSTLVTEIPAHWPEWYQRIVEARIDVVGRRRDIALIERPECKRRWATQPWEKKEAEALRIWMLDRCERRDYWFGLRDGFEQPRTLTVNQLADRFCDDQDMHEVARFYATSHLGKPDLSLASVLDQIIADQHVPYLAALRYKDTGLRKRKQWEQVWEQQREEDRTGNRLDIPVPPKYASADFRKTSYWSQRGRLDVPKERFISYPDANPDSDPTLLLGWAGWDHADQAQALVNLINDRTADAGWETERLTPLLAGLAEVMPWVHQWHNEYDEDWGGNPAEEYQAYLDEQRTKHQLTEADLTDWGPAPAKRGRKKDK